MAEILKFSTDGEGDITFSLWEAFEGTYCTVATRSNFYEDYSADLQRRRVEYKDRS